MIVLIVILSILLFLFLLTLFPLRADISFETEFKLTIKYLFLSFKILPEEAAQEATEQTEKTIEETSDKKKPSTMGSLKSFFKNEGAKGVLDFLSKVIDLFKNTLKSLLSHIKVKRFDFYYLVSGEDAADAAIKYGQVNLLVSSVYGFLFSLKKCKKPRVSVDLDYNAKDDKAMLNTLVSIKPIFLIIMGIKALVKGIPLFRRFKSSSNKNISNTKETIS